MSKLPGGPSLATATVIEENDGSKLSRKRRPHILPVIIPEKTRAVELPLTECASSESLDSLSFDGDEKRHRFDSGSTVDSNNELNIQSDALPSSSSCGVRAVAPECPQKRAELLEPLVNGSIFEHFEIVGAGKETDAIHLETREIYSCRVITQAEYQTIIKVVNRLMESEKYYNEPDAMELREMVFPSRSEIVEEEGGRKLLFTPRHHSSLHSFAHHRGYLMSEADVNPIFFQIVKMLAFCHAVGIVVREVKPRRLLFVDKDQTKLRLASVQEVIVCEDPHNDIIQDKFGSPAYVPPEVLSSGCQGYRGKPADIWGVGVVLYLLLVGRYPFYDTSPLGVFQKIKRSRFHFPPNAYLSRSARALIYGILRRDPAERPSANELAHMPWPDPPKTPVRARPIVPDVCETATMLNHVRRERAIAIATRNLRDAQEEWPRLNRAVLPNRYFMPSALTSTFAGTLPVFVPIARSVIPQPVPTQSC
jgi:hypothetical protein